MTTRRWLGVIAGLAFALAAWNEWYYRRLRDRAATMEWFFLKAARRFDAHREECLENERRHIAYPPSRDEWDTGMNLQHIGSPHPYKRWADEAKDDEARAAEFHKMAANEAKAKRLAERHLIFP
jgi:hypothetical protein